MDMNAIKKALSGKIIPTFDYHDGKTQLASVLVLIYGTEPTVLMTEKPKHMKTHGGEIAFPGGKWKDDVDSDLLETALRETREEIGLSISRDKVIGQLDPVRTRNSGFTIFSFVAVIDDIPQLKANPEVETIMHIPLLPFLRTLARDTDPNHHSIQEMYTLTYQGKAVWGASARILKQISNRIS